MLPDVRARLLNLGMETETRTPANYARYVQQEVATWRRVVTVAGIRLEQ